MQRSSLSYTMGNYPPRKVDNTKQVAPLEVVVMVETKSSEFWHGDEVGSYDD